MLKFAFHIYLYSCKNFKEVVFMKQENETSRIFKDTNKYFTTKSINTNEYRLTNKETNLSINSKDILLKNYSMQNQISSLTLAQERIQYIKKNSHIRKWISDTIQISNLLNDSVFNAVSIGDIKRCVFLSEIISNIQKKKDYSPRSFKAKVKFITPLDDNTCKEIKNIINEYYKDDSYTTEEALNDIREALKFKKIF